jgi:hypothetical protein
MTLRTQSVLAVLCLALGPAASAETLFLSTGTQLRSFDSASPAILQSTVNITGLRSGEGLVGIDFRPTTGQLFGLGSNGRLYTIERATGVATEVGGPFALTGNHFGFSFDPTTDRIRVVSDQELNLRLNPDTGAVEATDPTLGYASSDPNVGDNPAVAGASYTNSLAGFTTTTLYDVDVAASVLATQDPVNAGTLNTVGPLGVSSVDSAIGFDISGRTGTAYLALNRGSGTDLYTVNLTSGATTRVGPIGNPAISGVTGLAVVPSEGSCIPSTTALCLNRDRYRVSAVWQLADGTRGEGQAVQLTTETGYFWFFSSNNLELFVKVLDACSSFQRTWVFASGLTDVGVTVTVTDTRTSTTNTYNNPIGTPFPPIQDTHAFSTCP